MQPGKLGCCTRTSTSSGSLSSASVRLAAGTPYSAAEFKLHDDLHGGTAVTFVAGAGHAAGSSPGSEAVSSLLPDHGVS